MSQETMFWVMLAFGIGVVFLILAPHFYRGLKFLFQKTRYSNLGESSKIRLVRQLDDAVNVLSEEKTGAIITISLKDNLETLRTDGVKIDASISAPLILSIFNKYSPLHDGAIIIDSNKIVYAGTYYKITNKSIHNRYGARHRAAMGISEQSDALTIVVSEETGGITFSKEGTFTTVHRKEFQEKLIDFLG